MKNAWVCYCLLKDKGEGERLNAALQEIQGLMEQKEYDRLWQGFATGVEIAGSYPFCTTSAGSRASAFLIRFCMSTAANSGSTSMSNVTRAENPPELELDDDM